MSTPIQQLREIVNDERRPISERTQAAVHLVKLKESAVDTDVPDSDVEVLKLVAPWTCPIASKYFPVESQGMALSEAKGLVGRRWAFRAKLAAVLDESLPYLERLETTRVIFAGLHPGHYFRKNGFSAEQLMGSINGPDDTRQYMDSDGWYEYQPVTRPPVQLDDVWDVRRTHLGRAAL